MKLRVLAVGRAKERGLQEMLEQYTRRVRSPWSLSLDWYKSSAAMLTATRPTHVMLDERGQNMSSEALARWISDQRDIGRREIDFLIGDAYGFTDAQRQAAPLLLRLSDFVLPHRLATLLITEQLYRSYTILTGHPYHHE